MSIGDGLRQPPIRRATTFAAMVMASTFALTACASSEASNSGDGTGFIQGTGEITEFAAADRKPAPALSGETVDGEPLELSDYRGKIVVLNVWGSWCAPCRSEAPEFVEVAEDTEKQGVQFIGINTRELDVANAQAFERDFGVKYPSIYDPDGKLILKFKNMVSPKAIPSTLVLDRDHKIAARALTPLGAGDLRAMLKPLLAEK